MARPVFAKGSGFTGDESLNGHVEDAREMAQTACRDAVGSVFVFLHLLKLYTDASAVCDSPLLTR